LDAAAQERRRVELAPLGDGYFEVEVSAAPAGTLYDFVVDGRVLPDPYGRRLPHGVHGPAEVCVSQYSFQHPALARPLREQVIYELHVGTFSPEGTFEGARKLLPRLCELGVTTLELMPVAAFSGTRGWGYDGVALYAPHAQYGTPDQLRELVDAAHGLGLSVLLDVVYNHFGASGNYLGAYSTRYFCEDVRTAWGNAPNFAEPAMRDLVLENARYWLGELKFDGLRLDATHALVDASERHILQELATLAAAYDPPRMLIAEDDRNDASLVTRVGLDALWADDFHHQVRVTLTGERDGYYAAYEPAVAGIADAINGGWLYRGQTYPTTGEPRGSDASVLGAEQLVYCIQNHDQVGNRALGERLSADVGAERFRAAALLLLFLPMTPLLFMGQEWGASTPFLYFTDHDEELGKAVREGRRREFAGFAAFSDASAREQIPDPQAEATFSSSRLDWGERDSPGAAATLALHHHALELRRKDPVMSRAGRDELRAEALGEVLVVRRWHAGQERALLMSFGTEDTELSSLAAGLGLANVQVLLSSSTGRPRAKLPGGAAVILSIDHHSSKPGK
jgi:maltooligosyltrehalose trehalohydrolase